MGLTATSNNGINNNLYKIRREPPHNIQGYNSVQPQESGQNPKSVHSLNPLLASTGSKFSALQPLLTAYENLKSGVNSNNSERNTGQNNVRKQNTNTNVFEITSLKNRFKVDYEEVNKQSFSHSLDRDGAINLAAVQSKFNVHYSKKGNDAMKALQNIQTMKTFAPIDITSSTNNTIHRNAVLQQLNEPTRQLNREEQVSSLVRTALFGNMFHHNLTGNVMNAEVISKQLDVVV